ncbi:MAG: hypothetical protein ACI814_003780 [Mariniblastus sp.]|jgi:hypothetical protein
MRYSCGLVWAGGDLARCLGGVALGACWVEALSCRVLAFGL